MSYLKHHRDFFICLVSLLLLLSLIVREQFRDKAREKGEAVANVRNMFYLRMDVLRAPDVIIENIDAVNRSSRGSTIPTNQLEAELQKQLKNDFRVSIPSLHMVDTLSRMARALELSDKERITLKNIEDRNAERGQTFEKISNSLRDHTPTAQDYDAAVRIAADTADLDWNVLDFGTTLADKADAEVRLQETRYKWASAISYVLALCLWYLAFLGKLYDIDLPAE